jgi:hypothetical protein
MFSKIQDEDLKKEQQRDSITLPDRQGMIQREAAIEQHHEEVTRKKSAVEFDRDEMEEQHLLALKRQEAKKQKEEWRAEQAREKELWMAQQKMI